MTKFSYQEIEEALLKLDYAPTPDESDQSGDWVLYLFGEGRPEKINDFLQDNNFSHNDKKRIVEADLEKLPLIKEALEEIQNAYRSLNRRKPATYLQAYAIFGQWGLLTFTGAGKHPHFSDDGVEYASGYILQIIEGIEHCLKHKSKKKIA